MVAGRFECVRPVETHRRVVQELESSPSPTGFNASELAVCALLVSVLVGLALRSYSDTISLAVQVEPINLSVGHKVAWAEHFAVTGQTTIPTDGAVYGEPMSEDAIPGRYLPLAPERDEWGAVTFEFGPEARELEGHLLTFRPAVASGAVAWVCGRKRPASGFLVLGVDRTTVGRSRLSYACRGRGNEAAQ